MQRNYEAPRFGVQDTRELRRFEVSGTDTSANANIRVGDDSWRNKLLSNLLGQASDLSFKMANIHIANQYLEGQAAAGIVKSEEELESDPMTRDWKVAGYRDTMGKMALAESTAQFGVDIAKLREQDPSKMDEYIAKRRAELLPTLQGMSREARATTIGQLVLNDNADIRKYTLERSKFLIEEQVQAAATSTNTALRAVESAAQERLLSNNKTTADNLDAAVQSAVGTIYSNTYGNGRMDKATQQETAFNLLRMSLKSGPHVFDAMNSVQFPDDSAEGASTLMSRLTAPQQVQLAGEYKTAKDAMLVADFAERTAAYRQLSASLEDGTYPGNIEQLKGDIQQMYAMRVISDGEGSALLGKFYSNKLTADSAASLVTAAQHYNPAKLAEHGETPAKATDMLVQTYLKQGKQPDQIVDLLVQAHKWGNPAALPAAGKFISAAINQTVGLNGEVLPENKAVLTKVLEMQSAAKKSGRVGDWSGLYSGMTTDSAMLLMRVSDAMTMEDQSFDMAWRNAAAQAASDAAMTDDARAARGSKLTTAGEELILKATEPMGVHTSKFAAIKDIFGFSFDAKTRGKDLGWFSTPDTVRFYQNQSADFLRQSYGALARLHTGAKPEQLLELSKAQLQAHTVMTKYGPLVMPLGSDKRTVFGVAPDNQTLIGPAIDRMFKDTTQKDSHWRLSFWNGELMAQEVSYDGRPIGHGAVIQRDAVEQEIRAMNDEKQKKADQQYGSGVEVKAPGGSAVKVNGVNSAGVSAAEMLQFRKDLVLHEGNEERAKPDLSGKVVNGKPVMVQGIGLNSTSPHWKKYVDGKSGAEVGPALMVAFDAHSNGSMRAAAQAAKLVNTRNEAGTRRLFANIAYQAGDAFWTAPNTKKGYTALMQAMNSGDLAAAQEALRNTSVWRYSIDPKKVGDPRYKDTLTSRRKHYMDLLTEAMK